MCFQAFTADPQKFTEDRRDDLQRAGLTTRDTIMSDGYHRHTLHAAMWAVATTTTFEDALIEAVNLGEDTDTVGAVTGQLAGALDGFPAIPERWLKPLVWRNQLIDMAEQLIKLGGPIT
jgi:ADP-ribosyl-[dinitrogen reductase] hydrolase